MPELEVSPMGSRSLLCTMSVFPDKAMSKFASSTDHYARSRVLPIWSLMVQLSSGWPLISFVGNASKSRSIRAEHGRALVIFDKYMAVKYANYTL